MSFQVNYADNSIYVMDNKSTEQQIHATMSRMDKGVKIQFHPEVTTEHRRLFMAIKATYGL